MRLIPHGFTVLVEPDPSPERTDSGLILMPEDKDHVATSGVVVAVGKGSKRLWDDRQALLRKIVATAGDDGSPTSGYVHKLMRQIEPCPSVQVGDRVVFAPQAGLTVSEDGRSYILLEEDRIAIGVEEEESVA